MNPRVTEARKESPSRRYTFRGNVASTRHGWLRLTPAYSVHLVRELLEDVEVLRGPVLDPFCGTGTTLLACAERGLDCTTVDVNPFLVWLARAKTARYDDDAIETAAALVERMVRAARARSGEMFVPSIHRIERWWSGSVLAALGRAAAVARPSGKSSRAADLAALSLCRALISVANVSFGHQSMSFREPSSGARDGRAQVGRALTEAFAALAESARAALPRSKRRVVLGDSRVLGGAFGAERYGAVVTSPPYSNRMSYIRELRPYMYWLGYLTERRDAGELDWRAIGGTWGAATSRLGTWVPREETRIPFSGFDAIVRRISEREPLLGNYVHRYFEDMASHAASLFPLVAPGGRIHYVVGNSKFYDVLLPADQIFATLFEAVGFEEIRITVLRKRTSKRELYEYLVQGKKP